jgi:hypothetical protein
MSWYRNHGRDRFAIFNRMRDIPEKYGDNRKHDNGHRNQEYYAHGPLRRRRAHWNMLTAYMKVQSGYHHDASAGTAHNIRNLATVM